MRVRALLLIVLLSGPVLAEDPVLVAVASNFWPTFSELATAFESRTGIVVHGSSGSTGKLYAQIINGAPFDAYLAADTTRPERLVADGHGIKGTRYVYAVGRLVAWSKSETDCLVALRDPAAGRVALANPETAPYGKAAREFLVAMGAWDSQRPIYGTNVGQAVAFAATGNVAVAIVSRSQLTMPLLPDATCTYEVPKSMHEPIEQQAVLLDADNTGARQFLEFLRSDDARRIIVGSGYEVSE